MMWKAAWWLTKKEIKYNWFSFIFTLLATAIIALLISSLLEEYALVLSTEPIKYYNYFLLDFLFMAITTSLGALFMSAPYLTFRTIKEDPVSKRMAFYRTLPIPVKVLCLSRTVLMLITFLIMSISFYLIIFLTLSDRFYSYISPEQFLIFALTWGGYALTLAGLTTYLEFGTSGKMLHIGSFISVIFFLIFLFLFYITVKQSVVEWSLQLIKSYGWYPALFTLTCGGLGCYFWHTLLKRRLLTRDYV